jgi:hypothetical protein
MVSRLPPGRTVLRRYFRGETITFLNVARVIADDERGLRLWYPAGTKFWRIVDADGHDLHARPLEQMAAARLAELVWQGSDILVLMPPGAAYSVWWFFAAGTGDFQGWYGNLEVPYTAWDDGDVCGVDTSDQELDLEIRPDGGWRWKDADAFEARIGAPGYWTADEAADIRTEGERLAKLAESRAFPFDGTWCDFTPNPAWAIPRRPDVGWDRSRAN